MASQTRTTRWINDTVDQDTECSDLEFREIKACTIMWITGCISLGKDANDDAIKHAAIELICRIRLALEKVPSCESGLRQLFADDGPEWMINEAKASMMRSMTV